MGWFNHQLEIDYVPLDPKAKIKVLNPQYMGEIAPRNEGNMASHATWKICLMFFCETVHPYSWFIEKVFHNYISKETF